MELDAKRQTEKLCFSSLKTSINVQMIIGSLKTIKCSPHQLVKKVVLKIIFVACHTSVPSEKWPTPQ